jgi:hypothetical protein
MVRAAGSLECKGKGPLPYAAPRVLLTLPSKCPAWSISLFRQSENSYPKIASHQAEMPRLEAASHS